MEFITLHSSETVARKKPKIVRPGPRTQQIVFVFVVVVYSDLKRFICVVRIYHKVIGSQLALTVLLQSAVLLIYPMELIE